MESGADRPTILLLANYGSEVGATAGVLAKNVKEGGKSHAAVLLARPEAQDDIRAAGEHMGVGITFLDFEYGAINLDRSSRLKIARAVRETCPDIVLLQDPEHAINDMDPDRRMGCLVCLEGIALASRDFGLEEMPKLQPHPVPTLYYLWPENPNCIVDIADVLDLKKDVLGKLRYQMELTGWYVPSRTSAEGLERAVGGYSSMSTHEEKGYAITAAMAEATAIAYGLAGHGKLALAEAYRRKDWFELDSLPF